LTQSNDIDPSGLIPVIPVHTGMYELKEWHCVAKMKHVRQAHKHAKVKTELRREEVFSRLLPLSLQLAQKQQIYRDAHLGEEMYQLTEDLLYFSYEDYEEWSEKEQKSVLSFWADQLLEWGSSFRSIDPEEAWGQLQHIKDNEV
jgi:hypothetical protein